ncbi:DUF190 domain-containing protein [Legionella sp. WA2022007384]
MNYEKVSVYINEAEQWQNRPLYLELLNLLKKHSVVNGVIFRAVAGFPLAERAKSSLFHLSKKLPLIVQFIDSVDGVDALLPELKKMVPHHFIIRKPIEIISWGDIP